MGIIVFCASVALLFVAGSLVVMLVQGLASIA